MPRRVIVPAADELFRPTAVPDAVPSQQQGQQHGQQVVEIADAQKKGQHAKPAGRTASGRVKHDEKMTVYVTSDELLEIEHARLELRRAHGLAVDRGRIVRAAVALALADLDAHGPDAALVRRLREG